MSALEFLLKDEWTMGNGQCPDCCGNKPGAWAPHPCVPDKTYEGHRSDCQRALSIIELGGKVIFATNSQTQAAREEG